MINGTNKNNVDYANNDELDFQDSFNTDDSFENINGDFRGTDSSDVNNSENLTRNEWKQLLTKVQTEHPQNEKELLNIIRDAMGADLHHDQSKESDDISQLTDALGDDPLNYLNGQSNTDNDSETNNSDGATKVDADGTRHYVATQDNNDFDLKGSDKKTHYVVDTTGNVTITPASPDETFTVTSEGKYNVFTSSSGDVYKVDKRASVYVASDNVKGDVDVNGKVSYGTQDHKNLNSDKKIKDLANIIAASTSQIDYIRYDSDTSVNFNGKYGVGYHTPDKIKDILNGVSPDKWQETLNNLSAGAKTEADDIKAMLGKISDTLQSSNPDWNSVSDELSRWLSQDSTNGCNANNRAQLLFDVLYGELGESNFKWLLQNGIIPSDIAGKISADLKGASTENNDMAGEITAYQVGGPGWSHQSSADFLDKYSNDNTSAAE